MSEIPFGIPQKFIDFIDAGGELPDADNDFGITEIEKIEYVEQIYQHPKIDKEEGNEDSDPKEIIVGYYSIKFVELLPDELTALVWLPEIKCFGSIDQDHQVILAYEHTSWDDIMETPDFYIDGTQADVAWEHMLDFEKHSSFPFLKK